MTSWKRINLAVLPLLLQGLAPAYAQQDRREQEGPRPQRQEHASPPNHPGRPVPPAGGQPGKPPRGGRPNQPEPPVGVRPGGPPQDGRPHRPEPPIGVRPGWPPQAGRPNRPEPPIGVNPGWPPKEGKPARPEPPLPGRAGRPGPRSRTRPADQRAQREYGGRHSVMWGARRAGNWQAEHRTWEQRGGYQGYRMSPNRYQSRFGPSHGFRMFSYPLLVVDGFPRFKFGGMWLSVVDPWPEYWSDDWYGDDDLYIEFFRDGYYLRNRMHPLDRIAITVIVQ